MCGIFFSVCSAKALQPDDEIVKQLGARGPDSCQQHDVAVQTQSHDADQTDGQCPFFLTFLATVLALRGPDIQRQPIVDTETQSVLCWNGEAWKLGHERVAGNDTFRVSQSLLEAAKASSALHRPQNIMTVLSSIAGPFAFVFYDAASSKIYYGRDRFGRRSLMRSSDDSQALVLSSISSNTASTNQEVGTEGIYCVSLRAQQAIEVELLPWKTKSPRINRQLPTGRQPSLPIPDSVVELLREELSQAVRLRVADILSLAPQHSETMTKVAILFSGGLDCTILACLVHTVLPSDEPIDLLNVAFYNPRSVAANQVPAQTPYEACPDRITGRSSFCELVRSCPGRQWRFVAVNIPFEEVLEHRPLIVRLMQPHNTEMDLSIAMALYFAARGRGIAEGLNSAVEQSPLEMPTPYKTTARVLLSGLGADELFGGYTRHSNAFMRRGYLGLVDELELDFQRIGQRNLGRDDRVMSYWGKEVRYPYLDEDFVRFTLDLVVWEKCGFREDHQSAVQPDVEPAKALLRMLALKLGLEKAAREKKRAIQFGARTAKMEIGRGRRKGTDVLD